MLFSVLKQLIVMSLLHKNLNFLSELCYCLCIDDIRANQFEIFFVLRHLVFRIELTIEYSSSKAIVMIPSSKCEGDTIF